MLRMAYVAAKSLGRTVLVSTRFSLSLSYTSKQDLMERYADLGSRGAQSVEKWENEVVEFVKMNEAWFLFECAVCSHFLLLFFGQQNWDIQRDAYGLSPEAMQVGSTCSITKRANFNFAFCAGNLAADLRQSRAVSCSHSLRARGKKQFSLIFLFLAESLLFCSGRKSVTTI